MTAFNLVCQMNFEWTAIFIYAHEKWKNCAKLFTQNVLLIQENFAKRASWQKLCRFTNLSKLLTMNYTKISCLIPIMYCTVHCLKKHVLLMDSGKMRHNT